MASSGAADGHYNFCRFFQTLHIPEPPCAAHALECCDVIELLHKSAHQPAVTLTWVCETVLPYGIYCRIAQHLQTSAEFTPAMAARGLVHHKGSAKVTQLRMPLAGILPL